MVFKIRIFENTKHIVLTIITIYKFNKITPINAKKFYLLFTKKDIYIYLN